MDSLRQPGLGVQLCGASPIQTGVQTPRSILDGRTAMGRQFFAIQQLRNSNRSGSICDQQWSGNSQLISRGSNRPGFQSGLGSLVPLATVRSSCHHTCAVLRLASGWRGWRFISAGARYIDQQSGRIDQDQLPFLNDHSESEPVQTAQIVVPRGNAEAEDNLPDQRECLH